MAVREYLADYWCGDCGVIVRLVPYHPLPDEPLNEEIIECPICAQEMECRQYHPQRESADESAEGTTVPTVGEEGA